MQTLLAKTRPVFEEAPPGVGGSRFMQIMLSESMIYVSRGLTDALSLQSCAQKEDDSLLPPLCNSQDAACTICSTARPWAGQNTSQYDTTDTPQVTLSTARKGNGCLRTAFLIQSLLQFFTTHKAAMHVGHTRRNTQGHNPGHMSTPS